MELQKAKLHCQRPVAYQTVYREESAECIVPDSQPDIDRILDVRALALVRDRECDANTLKLRCTIRAVVLYAAQEDSAVYSLEVPISYTHAMGLRGVEARDEAVVTARAVQADAHLVNSRRVSVRTTTAIRAAVFRESDEEIACGAQEEGLCVKTRAQTLACTAAVTARNFTVAQDIELDEGACAAERVLCASLALEALETKLLAGRATVRAQGTVQALYRGTDEGLHTLEKSFTFTQSADLSVSGEGCEAKVCFALRSFDLESAADMSGESRYLSLSAAVTMFVEAVEETEVEVLEDLYGLRRALSFTCRELGIPAPGKEARIRTQTQEEVDTVLPAQKILCAHTVPDLLIERTGEETLSCACQLSLLYEGTDGALYGAAKRVILRFTAQDIDAESALVKVLDVRASASSDGIRAELDAVLEGQMQEREKVTAVESAEWGEEYPADEKGLSAIVVRMPEKESIWEIAKRHHTTSAAIEAANAEVDLQAPGAWILIPL